MLIMQKKYLDYLTELNKELVELKKSDDSIQNICNEIDGLKKEIIEIELLVPIIGAFSSGKTSLINSFLNEGLLPVGITPETSLATELRYSSRRYIQGVDENNSVNEFDVSDIESIKDHAEKYKLIRVYLDIPLLKEIEPLILVDMPGFDSPLDLHNQAIFNYINKGSHYIVLTSIEDGSITKSMLRQLIEIQEFERDFSFFLSKSNLRADSEVEEVKEKIEEQLSLDLDASKNIRALGLNQGSLLKEVIDEIEPERLFEKLFFCKIKELTFRILGLFNTAVSVLTKTKTENEASINELKLGIERIIKKRDELIDEAQNKYSNNNVDIIINRVGKALSGSIDELTQSYLHGGTEALSQNMTDLIKFALVSEIKELMSNIGNKVIDDFAAEITNVSVLNVAYTMDEDLLKKISDSTKGILSSASSSLSGIVEQRKSNVGANVSYKAITSVLAATTTVVMPVFELIIVFLPEILSGFFDMINQKKKEEAVRQQIMTGTIPQIKGQLRNELPPVFNEQIKVLINEISNSFEKEMEVKKQQVTELEALRECKIKEIEEKIKTYDRANEQIKMLATETLFQGGNQ
ncbi:MAG: dynamin family protein [Acetobacterium sp.]|uniref:dynamin family protein n=1 Tax=Acetobacterium sp. TaxID=1872094 RepID=UPI003242F5F8